MMRPVSSRIAVLACPVLLLLTAVVQLADPVGPVPLPQSLVRQEPRAQQLLVAALARLVPEQTPWLETRLWQRTRCGLLGYEAQGYFRAGPGQRRQLFLEVRTERARDHLLLVCDGQRLLVWRGLGGARRLLWQGSLSGEEPTAAADVLQRQGAEGPAGLLRRIGQCWLQPRCHRLCWGNREVFCLSGHWPARRGPDAAGSEPQVRWCRVYLEARTLWPCRIEWWGGATGQADQLLSEVEFFSPVLYAQPPASWQPTVHFPTS